MDAGLRSHRVLLVALLSLSFACSSPSGEGAALEESDEGATPGDAGAEPDAASPGDAAQVDGLASMAPGACPADIGSPRASGDKPRGTLPFTYVPASGTPDTTCVHSGDGIRCRGPVAVQRSATRLELVLADGSRLVWSATAGAMTVRPPLLADGDAAWIAYDHDEICVSGCFGGRYQRDQLEIRSGETGRVLWLAMQGQELASLGDDRVLELFGVKAHAQASCRHSFAAGCWTAERTIYDHVLETTPPALLHHAQVERVSTAKGSYDVLWAESMEDVTYDTRCADGPEAAHDRGFAASWVGP
jgi:hypothetical protein